MKRECNDSPVKVRGPSFLQEKRGAKSSLRLFFALLPSPTFSLRFLFSLSLHSSLSLLYFFSLSPSSLSLFSLPLRSPSSLSRFPLPVCRPICSSFVEREEAEEEEEDEEGEKGKEKEKEERVGGHRIIGISNKPYIPCDILSCKRFP